MMMPHGPRIPSGLGLPARVVSPGWPQGRALEAQPTGAPGPLGALPAAAASPGELGASRQGGMVVLVPPSPAASQPLPSSDGPWAGMGAWLGMAWATCRAGLRRLAGAMEAGPSPADAGQAAAVGALELVGALAQVAMTPCIGAGMLATQVAAPAAGLVGALVGAGAGLLASWAEGAEAAWQGFQRAFRAAADAR